MLIEVDEYKKNIPEYDPKRSELFHEQSAKLADRDFILALKTKKYKNIIFMAGGTASGKTEFAVSYLSKKDNLVYDGTLKNFSGLKIKLQKIERYSKKTARVKVVLIIPEDQVKSLAAFLKRERKMDLSVFFDTHIKSRLTVAKILKDTKIRVNIYVSSVNEDSDKLRFIRLTIKRRNKIAKDLIETANILNSWAKEIGLDINTNFDNM